MSNQDSTQEIKERRNSYFRSLWFDSVYLILSIIALWGIDQVLDKFPLEGLNAWVIQIFMLLFTLSTCVKFLWDTGRDLLNIVYDIRLHWNRLRDKSSSPIKHQLPSLDGEFISKSGVEDKLEMKPPKDFE